jgi:GT2 family glycosyltransferase
MIASSRNLGFGRANNRAITRVKNDLVWLLNPDTRLLPEALDNAAAFMVRHPSFGMAGTALTNPDGSLQSSVEHRYPGQRYAGSALGPLPGEIAWVSGASIMARREVLRTVGGFDERFFLYGEEIDLCLTVRRSGWPIGFIRDAVVMHHGGGSERARAPVSVMEKKFKAEMLFYTKHYPETAIETIKRKNRLQASWRLTTLAPMRLMMPNNRTVRRKFDFYLLSWRFFRS